MTHPKPRFGIDGLSSPLHLGDISSAYTKGHLQACSLLRSCRKACDRDSERCCSHAHMQGAHCRSNIVRNAERNWKFQQHLPGIQPAKGGIVVVQNGHERLRYKDQKYTSKRYLDKTSSSTEQPRVHQESSQRRSLPLPEHRLPPFCTD